MNYNKILVICSILIFLSICLGFYCFGNTLDVKKNEVIEEIKITPYEIK